MNYTPLNTFHHKTNKFPIVRSGIRWLFGLILAATIATAESNHLCLKGDPQNIGDPTGGSPPFNIDVTPRAILNNQWVHLWISATSADVTILGVRLDAIRRDTGMSFGHFQLRSGEPYDQSADCGNGFKDVVFGVDGEKREMLIDWVCPQDFVGEMEFNATIAQTEQLYWVNVPSAVVKVYAEWP